MSDHKIIRAVGFDFEQKDNSDCFDKCFNYEFDKDAEYLRTTSNGTTVEINMQYINKQHLCKNYTHNFMCKNFSRKPTRIEGAELFD